jgi:hypothetical protein
VLVPPLRSQRTAFTPGWSLRCPVCWRLVLPADGSLHFAVAPRLSWHLWSDHPFETRLLLLHLSNPPREWPELIDGEEAIQAAYRSAAA